MTDEPQQDLESVLGEFFGCTEPEHIHHALHELTNQAERSHYSELPRKQLVDMALERDRLKQAVDQLSDAIVEEWNLEDWPVSESIRDALDALFEVYFGMDETENHTAEVSVPPTGAIVRRNGRGRGRA